MHRYILAAVPILLGGICLHAKSEEIRPDRYLQDIRYLSSGALQGRGTGSAGLDKAAHYIAHEFAKAGVRPLGTTGYLQGLPVFVQSSLGTHNRAAYENGTALQALGKDDFTPFNFSENAQASGQLVFAGYGITAPEYGYDDYSKIDARDKVVLILRHEPQEFDDSSVFEGRIYTEHSQWFSKAWNARVHGARAVVVVSDTINHTSDALEPFVNLVGPASAGIPVIHVKAAVAERWFTAAGKDLKALQEVIDKNLEPQSFAFPPDVRLSMAVDVQHKVRNVNNVVGYLPGETSEYIVVGAHYDHLGLGEQYSLAPTLAGTMHPGADDNASGTAGLLALARWFGAQPRGKRGIVFLAFAGEELGLLGSSYYVNHPQLPLQNAALMINLDMIGRIRDGKVMVTGAQAGSNLRAALQALEKGHGLHLQLDDGGVYGSSDHTAFTTKLIPILFFFSGLHDDYHRPSDTWDKINSRDGARLLRLIADLIVHVSREPERPAPFRSGTGVRSPHAAHAGGVH